MLFSKIIQTDLDKSEVINRIRDSVYTTDEYSHMKWQERYRCDKDYYGDFLEDRINLCRTNSSGERTGTQHLLFRVEVSSDSNGTVIKVDVFPNINHILVVLCAFFLVVYAFYTLKWICLIGSLLVVIVDIASIVNDYDSFNLFVRNLLK